MESPHDVLGIDSGAGETAIERAYRRRVKETHPDRGGSMRAFLEVRWAYEELRDGADSPDADAAAPRSGDAVDTDVGDAAAGSESPDSSREEGSRAEPVRVEYLDYDAVTDHDWTLSDDDLFEKARASDLEPGDHGRFLVEPGESLLEAAENRGFVWPYACRGGACANCAVAVRDGDLSIPVNHVLPDELVDRDVRLSCVGAPTGEELRVVFNVKHLPDLEDLRLPPHPFEQARRGSG